MTLFSHLQRSPRHAVNCSCLRNDGDLTAAPRGESENNCLFLVRLFLVSRTSHIGSVVAVEALVLHMSTVSFTLLLHVDPLHRLVLVVGQAARYTCSDKS